MSTYVVERYSRTTRTWIATAYTYTGSHAAYDAMRQAQRLNAPAAKNRRGWAEYRACGI